MHHHVHISDAALVAAATLSQRYRYGTRFLPDKAIDLLDEAAARVKIQLDLKPQQIDTIDREIDRLKWLAGVLLSGLFSAHPTEWEGAS